MGYEEQRPGCIHFRYKHSIKSYTLVVEVVRLNLSTVDHNTVLISEAKKISLKLCHNEVISDEFHS
jgi:hypothetical protein